MYFTFTFHRRGYRFTFQLQVVKDKEKDRR